MPATSVQFPTIASVRPEWLLADPPDPAAVSSLCAELGLPEPICRLLVSRGYADPAHARAFLRPNPAQIHPPHLLAGMGGAVERLAVAAARGETVLIHGDYDVDGICATALLVRAFTMMGLRCVPFVPHRLRDGYDLTDAGVAAAQRAGATLIVTADCGIVADEAVRQARLAGLDVIVTDHHTPGASLPDAFAVINPSRPDCDYPEKGLAGVGVAFKLAAALADRLDFPSERLTSFLDLVAIATIADLAPLTSENRALVRWGLAVLARTPNVGLRALIRSCGLGDHEEITAGQIGFVLAPRLNAAGRMGDAMRGVRLLLTDDPREGEALAAELELENRRRRDLDEETLADALRMLENSYDPERDFGLVLASDRWHPGVIGIVASRVVERIHRPTVLVALRDGEGKGSGRSIPGFHLQKALVECAPFLLRYGGHRAAAGCSVAPERLSEFRMAFNAVARGMLEERRPVPTLRLDGEIPLSHASRDLVRLLRHFSPFGIGNPTPVFAAYGVAIAGVPRIVGKGHLKIVLAADDSRLDAIGFGMADRIDSCTGRRIDVAFKLEENSWQGRDGAIRTSVQARLVDFRPAQ
ncbi:MAG: single-stranded-DNA-specific exonuclease RecJ [Gemmatimonadota bacterium]